MSTYGENAVAFERNGGQARSACPKPRYRESRREENPWRTAALLAGAWLVLSTGSALGALSPGGFARAGHILPLAACSPASAAPAAPPGSGQAFAEALERGTVQAFEAFLKAYPDAPEAQEARERIDWLREDEAYEAARARNDEEGYRQFLGQYPKAVLAEEVQLRLQALQDARAREQTDRAAKAEADRRRGEAYAEARKADSAPAYRVFLAAYPDAPEAAEAKKSLEAVEAGERAVAAAPPSSPSAQAYADAVRKGTEESLQEFLKSYPQSQEAPEARDRIAWNREDAAYEKARTQDSEEGYREFLRQYPDSVLREEVELRVKALEDAKARKDLEQKAKAEAERRRAEVFGEAVKVDTATAYRLFLSAYPDAPEALDARRRMEAAEADDAAFAKAAGSDEGLKAYLAANPNGRHAREARDNLEALRKAPETPPAPSPSPSAIAFAEAIKAGGLPELEAFLKTHPASPEAPEARARIERLRDDAAFAVAARSEQGLTKYLAAHPDSPHAGEARERLQALRDAASEEAFREAMGVGTAEALEAFLKAYPENPRAPEARAAMAARTSAKAEPPKPAEAPASPSALVAVFVPKGPAMNGRAEDRAWDAAPAVEVPLTGGRGPKSIRLRAVHDGRRIYFLAQWSDRTRDAVYRPWRWNPTRKAYFQQDTVDDGLVVLLYRGKAGAEPSATGGPPSEADAWLWRAFWSEISGLADDGVARMGRAQSAGATPYPSPAGGQIWVREQPDAGSSGWSFYVPVRQQGPDLPSFRRAQPSGSRADVSAVGTWNSGAWTVELARALSTRGADDVDLREGGSGAISFGVYDRTEASPQSMSPVVRLEIRGR